jgi:hypothetical protein
MPRKPRKEVPPTHHTSTTRNVDYGALHRRLRPMGDEVSIIWASGGIVTRFSLVTLGGPAGDISLYLPVAHEIYEAC